MFPLLATSQNPKLTLFFGKPLQSNSRLSSRLLREAFGDAAFCHKLIELNEFPKVGCGTK